MTRSALIVDETVRLVSQEVQMSRSRHTARKAPPPPRRFTPPPRKIAPPPMPPAVRRKQIRRGYWLAEAHVGPRARLPRRHGPGDQRTRRRAAHLLGAVGLVDRRGAEPAGVRAAPHRRRQARRADRPLGRPGRRVPAAGDAALRAGDERRLAAVVDRRQRQPRRRLRRRLAPRARALPRAPARPTPSGSGTRSPPTTARRRCARCSPAPDEVDWLAVDGYNWGPLRAWGWQSYADIFAPTRPRAPRARAATAR